MRLWNITFSIFIVLLGLSGCTRAVKNDSAVQLSFSSESLDALSSDLSTVIINVTGSGISKPAYLHWDRESCGQADCAIPSSFKLEIPSGSNRLIQVLTVYEADGGGLDFKYADLTKTLTAGNVEVVLEPVSIGTATTEGHIYGRYLNQGGAVPTGPTGNLEARFKPPGGKPSMLIMSQYMFNGWFNAFVLDGNARFDYVLNGEVLTDLKDLHLGSPILNDAANTRILKVDIPEYERRQFENGMPVFESERAQKFFIGFFGPAATAQTACFENNSNITVSGAFQSGSNGAFPFLWNGSASTASSTATKYAWPEAGGAGFNAASTGNVCLNSATDFSDHLIFRHRNLNNGHDGLAGMRGPFKAMTMGTYDSFLNGSVNGANLTLDWEYLPGAANAQGVSSARVMARRRIVGANYVDLRDMGDGLECARLQEFGFKQFGGEVPAPLSELTAPLEPGTSLGDYDVIVCPMVAGKFTNAGIALEGGAMAAPMFKLVGTTPNASEVYGPGLHAGVRLLKSHATNGEHKLIVQANGRFIKASDVTSVEAEFNGSGSWATLSVADYSFGTHAGSFLAVSLNSAFRSLHPSMSDANADTSVKFRVSLPVGHDPGLPDSFESDSLMLVGATACPSPGNIVPEVGGSTAIPAGDLLNNIFSINGTDQTVSFKLRWSGCSTGGPVYAPFDYMGVSTTSMVPTNCFSAKDIKRNPADFLSIIVDPKDGVSGDCTMTDLDLRFRTADAGVLTSMVRVQQPSVTIGHSTLPVSYGLAAVATDIVSVGYHGLFYELALLGAGVTFDAQALHLNSDGRITNTASAGVAGDGVSWSAGNILNWFTTALPLLNDHLTFTTALTPSGGPLRALTVSEPLPGIKTGSAALGVTSNFNVLASSAQEIDGGSPLMVISDGTTLSLGYVPANSGNFAGQSLKLLGLPVAGNVAAGVDFSKVFLVNRSNGRNVFVAIGRGAQAQYLFGSLNGSGDSLSVNWAPVETVSPEDISDVTVSGGLNPRPIIQAQHTISFEVVIGNFPALTGTTWSGTALGVTDSLSLGPQGFIGNIGFAECASKIYAVGIGNLSSFKAIPVNPVMSSLGTTLIHADPVSGSQVTCLGLGADESAPLFVVTDPVSANKSAFAFESAGTPVCGGTSNAALSTTGAFLPTPFTGGMRGIIPAQYGLGSGFYYLYQGNAAETWITFANANCNSGNAYVYGGSARATLVVSAGSLNGLTTLNQSGTGAARFALFGEKQYYLLRQ